MPQESPPGNEGNRPPFLRSTFCQPGVMCSPILFGMAGVVTHCGGMTVAGHRLGALEEGGGVPPPPPNGTSRHIQHSPGTPTTGLCERGNDTSKSTGRSGRQNAATRRNMRREERVTVQGPVKEQQPDGMSHRGMPPPLPNASPPGPPAALLSPWRAARCACALQRTCRRFSSTTRTS